MKNILSWLVVASFSLLPIVTLSIPHDNDTVMKQERRKITPLPKWPVKFKKEHVEPFSHNLEMFLSDRIVGRDFLLQLASHFPAQEDYHLSVKGCDGWLFLGNKFESYVDSLIGLIKPTKTEVRDKCDAFVSIHDALAQRGIKFHIMVGPNKARVYPEYLPRTIISSKIRYIDPILKALNQAGIDVYDPTALLKAKKSDNILYWRTDSHWNQLGSLLATEAFLEHCGLPGLPPYTYKEDGVSPSDLTIAGGLDADDVPMCGDNFVIQWADNMAGRRSDKKILVVGDSFSELPVQYLREGYASVRHAHYVHDVLRDKHKTLAENLAAYVDSLPERPDVVLWIEVERYWLVLP